MTARAEANRIHTVPQYTSVIHNYIQVQQVALASQDWYILFPLHPGLAGNNKQAICENPNPSMQPQSNHVTDVMIVSPPMLARKQHECHGGNRGEGGTHMAVAASQKRRQLFDGWWCLYISPLYQRVRPECKLRAALHAPNSHPHDTVPLHARPLCELRSQRTGLDEKRENLCRLFPRMLPLPG